MDIAVESDPCWIVSAHDHEEAIILSTLDLSMVEPFCAGSFSSLTDRCSNRASKVLVAIPVSVSMWNREDQLLSLLLRCSEAVSAAESSAVERNMMLQVYFFHIELAGLTGQRAWRGSAGVQPVMWGADQLTIGEKKFSDLSSTNIPAMSRATVPQRSVRARRDEEGEYGSSASENEELDTVEGGSNGTEESSDDTETTVSKEDVSNCCCT